MARKGDDAQVLLLAGILVVIAFVLFSIQLSLLVNSGQQSGRETENPLLDDFLNARRSLESLLSDDLRDSSGTVRCPPDVSLAMSRVNSTLATLTALEENRGQSLVGILVAYSVVGTQVSVTLQLQLSDASSSITDKLDYKFTCTA